MKKLLNVIFQAIRVTPWYTLSIFGLGIGIPSFIDPNDFTGLGNLFGLLLCIGGIVCFILLLSFLNSTKELEKNQKRAVLFSNIIFITLISTGLYMKSMNDAHKKQVDYEKEAQIWLEPVVEALRDSDKIEVVIISGYGDIYPSGETTELVEINRKKLFKEMIIQPITDNDVKLIKSGDYGRHNSWFFADITQRGFDVLIKSGFRRIHMRNSIRIKGEIYE